MENIIEVKNLTRDYGYGRGIFDISFAIKKGETFGFLGPNGAGKTTTIRHLMGFSKALKGEAKILGKDSFKHYAEVLKHVGYIPGELAFPAGLTGYELIKMMQNLVGVRKKQRLEKLCEIFKLDHNQLKVSTKQMSLGTKRKLAIVTAFMSDPDILVLDEPTSGLDPLMQDAFIAFIRHEKERGKTILLSSHIFNEVNQTCDRISIIKDGKIVDTFIANDLKHAKHKLYSLTFKTKVSFKKFLQEAKTNKVIDVQAENIDTKQIVILTHDDDINEVITLLTYFDLVEFNHKKETLEQYFLKFYRDGKDFGGLE